MLAAVPIASNAPGWSRVVAWLTTPRTIFFAYVTVASLVASQVLVRGAVAWAAKAFRAPRVASDLTSPQETIGYVESLAYPWIIFFAKGDAATAIVGWIGLKTLGNWSRWKSSAEDPDEGRRRIYSFILRTRCK